MGYQHMQQPGVHAGNRQAWLAARPDQGQWRECVLGVVSWAINKKQTKLTRVTVACSALVQSVGGVKVTGVRDLGTGLDTTQPDGKAVLPWTQGDMMLTLFFAGGGALTLRASATEPKLKYYLEIKGSDRAAAEALASQVEAAITEDLVQPQAAGLKTRVS